MRGSGGGEPEDGEGPTRADWQDVENHLRELEARHGQELADAVPLNGERARGRGTQLSLFGPSWAGRWRGADPAVAAAEPSTAAAARAVRLFQRGSERKIAEAVLPGARPRAAQASGTL
jgi:hypothetical protein